MEFTKSKNKRVPAPYWMFISELSKYTNTNPHVLKSLKLVMELWTDRLVNGTYKVIVKDIKKDLEEFEIGRYQMSVTLLSQLMHDDVINENI